VAERHPDALKYFPPGSRLLLSAEGDRGDAWESGYLCVYCQLRYPAANGSTKTSSRESLTVRSSSGVASAFEYYLRTLEGKVDSSID
jgi:hypothetical protein